VVCVPAAPSNSQTLKDQYGLRVAADLRHNAEESERITGQIAALQAQLEVLQQDREMLLGMQQAVLATSGAESAQAAPPVAVKARREKAAKESSALRTGVPAEAGTSGESGGVGAEEAARAAKPVTVVELVRSHLVEQGVPRSAAEVAAGISTDERPVAVNSVRTALEGLARKSVIHRSKQGQAVYYEAVTVAAAGPESADPEQPSESEEQQEQQEQGEPPVS
jgi:hypothetical protein